ncbi:hypothetical protein EUTSA_v10023503mg [Eutrema salsugineum]|uniref:Uncharacterized protein n=1 Tax=Eutrema salsugineum TaxID=72664 RepID=V4KPG5_EUTSA|nr:probable transcription factor At1g61730 [Eutrema salsugineum]ESQ29258.1 hypothetical protein EUTSA_v10023503mg [Eutrema salsugineum]
MSKKLNPLEDPPTASSSDEEEVETSAGEEEEEDDSSSEEEDEPLASVIKPPSAAAVTIAVPGKTTVPSAAKEASDSDAGSETETDSDSETEQPSNPQGSGKSAAVTVAASAATKPKKKEEAQPSVILASPAAKAGAKRPSEGNSKEANSKRAKKVTSGDDEKKIGEDSKKPAFQRLWTEEDEITVLQGMIDFKADTGKSPYEDTNLYYDFIKKSISFDVSKNQFMDKIRSLKKKYMSKGKTAFTKPHDQKSFKLCQNIWGPEGMALESAVKSNGVSKKSQKTKKLDSVKQELSFASSPNGKAVEEDKRVLAYGGDLELPVAVKKPDWFENSFLARSIASFGVDEYSVKQRWSLVPVENKKKVEEKLKMLQAKEIEFVLEKTQFLHEVTSMIAEASKNKTLDI